MDLITLQEFKDYNGIKKPDEDARHQMLISSISALIKTYLGLQTETGRVVNETISLDYDTDTIFLDNYPVDEILSIDEVGRYTTDSTVHVPLYYASDYILDQADGTLHRVRRVGGFANWPVSPGIIKVSYSIGSRFNELQGEIPGDLKLATIELVNYYKNEEWKSKTITGTTTNAVSILKDSDFPKHIQVILDRYS